MGSNKRLAESEAVGGAPPPPNRKKSKKSKKSGISNIAALAQQQQAQKAEQSASGGGGRRGGKRKTLSFREAFNKDNYLLINRPKGIKSGPFTNCELHLWEKERYESTPANKRTTPPKDYASFPLPPARVIACYLQGGVGQKGPNWSPTNISSWECTVSLDYSKDQEPVYDQYAEDAWAQTQQADAAEAGDLLEDFQEFLADSARENSIKDGQANAFPGLMEKGSFKPHVTTKYILGEMRKVDNEDKVSCTLCIHKNADGKRIVKLRTRAYYEYKSLDDWVAAMNLTPSEKREYLQGKTEEDKKSQLKEISKKRGVPIDMANHDTLHEYLSESVENRDAFAMAYGFERVFFDLKEPQSPYKHAKKELREAQEAYTAACGEFHAAELVGLETGRSSDQDLREAKIAKSKADARVKRARRDLEIASKDKGKKVWKTVANCKEIQKTKSIVNYGDYISPMVKRMGARAYMTKEFSTHIYLTPTILHIASRPKYEQELPDMIEGAHAVNEDSDEDELMEDIEEEEDEARVESGDEAGSAAEDDSDNDLADILGE